MQQPESATGVAAATAARRARQPGMGRCRRRRWDDDALSGRGLDGEREGEGEVDRRRRLGCAG